MEAFKRIRTAGAFWVMLVVTGYGQYAQQTITLTKGWNAVYVQVQPDDARCEVVFADWTVSSVSLYNMAHNVARFKENPDEPVNRVDEFLTWEPGRPAGANTLNTVLAGHSYLMYATLPGTRTLTGRPAVPRIEWIPSTNACNLIGFRQNGSALFGSYLAGSGLDISKLSVYSVSGTNILNPTLQQVGGFSGLNATPIVLGKSYFFVCDKVSSFSGPIKVYPSGTSGIFFSTNNSFQTLRMKNEHGSPLDVTVTLVSSAAAPSGVVPSLLTLKAFDYLTGWQTMERGVHKTLADGEDWVLPLALDRTVMVAGQAYGGLLVCTDTAGGRIEIPLEAEYALPNSTHALWPAGLWVGKASLNQVSQVEGNSNVVHGVKAGGTMEFRLILHVDTTNRCRLLQRVIIAGAGDTNGSWAPALYVDEAKVPSGVQSVRISSVAFGLTNNITWDETYGKFGDKLKFTYLIAADDSVNPFRHPFHPDHDGLDAKFKTKLPSGDNTANYIGVIKPELFSISNKLRLEWTNASAVGGSSALWNPSEKVTGDIYYEVLGLRREGEILMKGLFELRRISPVGALSL